MEDQYYSIDLNINSIKTIYRAVNETLDRWPGGDPYEQESLYQLRNGFYRILLEDQYQSNIK